MPARLTDLISAQRPAMAAYADARHARTRCHEASERFTAACRAAGMQAQTWPAWADELGLSERRPTPWLQDSSHCVSAVWWQERIFTVDWTAAQYGRPEFPLVREVDVLPRRDPWLLTAQEAAALMEEVRAAAHQERDAR